MLCVIIIPQLFVAMRNTTLEEKNGRKITDLYVEKWLSNILLLKASVAQVSLVTVETEPNGQDEPGR